MDFIFDFVQITEIKTFELKLKFGFGLHGRVHITEVTLLHLLVPIFELAFEVVDLIYKMSRLCCFVALSMLDIYGLTLI